MNSAKFFQILGGVFVRPKAATAGNKPGTIIGIIGRQTESGFGRHGAGFTRETAAIAAVNGHVTTGGDYLLGVLIMGVRFFFTVGTLFCFGGGFGTFDAFL